MNKLTVFDSSSHNKRRCDKPYTLHGPCSDILFCYTVSQPYIFPPAAKKHTSPGALRVGARAFDVSQEIGVEGEDGVADPRRYAPGEGGVRQLRTGVQ